MPTVLQFANQNGCNTGPLRPLNNQIIAGLMAVVNTEDETNLVRCDDIPLLSVVGGSTIPFLQPAARDSLQQIIEQEERELELIHACRTIAQQFVLLQWRINGTCDITSARKPGRSDHERAIAVDIENSAPWIDAFESNGWEWAGPGDRGHFSFRGPGVNQNVIIENVRAFQKLWNLNHPDDPIVEDGIYGENETAPRLRKSPIEGFEIVI